MEASIVKESEMDEKCWFDSKPGNIEVCVDKLTEEEHLVASLSYDENGAILPDSYRQLSQIYGTREEAMRRFNAALRRNSFSETVVNLTNGKSL